VLVTLSARNTTILNNRIFDNAGLGIDLTPITDETTNLAGDGVTPNDAGDADSGPNNLQNYPLLTGITATTVTGTLNSTRTPLSLSDFSVMRVRSIRVRRGQNVADVTGSPIVTTTPAAMRRLASRSPTQYP